MSIEKEIPRDISKYEVKTIGPFTTRQVVCGVPGIGLGVGAYFLTKPFVGEDVAFFVAVLIAMPLLLMGFAKPYGIPFEKFLSIVFVSLVLAPKHRKYITENTFKDLTLPDEQSTDKSCTTKKKKKKKKVAYTGEHTQYL